MGILFQSVLFIQVGLSFLFRPSSSLSCIPSSCANWRQTPRGPLPLWSISDPSVACVSITTLPIKETEQNTGFYHLRVFVTNTATGLGSCDRSLKIYFWNMASLSVPGLTEAHPRCFLKNACHTRWLASISYIFLLTCALWPLNTKLKSRGLMEGSLSEYVFGQEWIWSFSCSNFY